jgi:hypothetical protein
VTVLLGGTIARCAHRVERERKKRNATNGVLSVRSAPPGARVVVDGREVPGRTPLFARDLRRGVPLPVEVRLDGYRPWRGSGQVHKDYGDGVLLVNLEPLGAASAPASAPAPAAAAPAALPARPAVPPAPAALPARPAVPPAPAALPAR